MIPKEPKNSRLRKPLTRVQCRKIDYLTYLLDGCLFQRGPVHLILKSLGRSLKRAMIVISAGFGASILAVLTLLLGFLKGILIVLGMYISLYTIRWGAEKVRVFRMHRLVKKISPIVGAHNDQHGFTSWRQLPFDEQTRNAIDVAIRMSPNDELVIGRIDNDGRVMGLYGELPGLKNINQSEFAARYRYPLDIVLVGDYILLRKDFRGDKANFMREWYNLSLLHGKANVPAVHHVDETRCILYKNFIWGRTLRDILVDAGASILNVETDGDTSLDGLDQTKRLEEILARGTALIPKVVSEDFIVKMEVQLDKIHSLAFAHLSLTFGNIIMDSHGEPWFIDFEGVKAYGSTRNLIFQYRRDQDRINFNKIYGRELTVAPAKTPTYLGCTKAK